MSMCACGQLVMLMFTFFKLSRIFDGLSGSVKFIYSFHASLTVLLRGTVDGMRGDPNPSPGSGRHSDGVVGVAFQVPHRGTLTRHYTRLTRRQTWGPSGEGVDGGTVQGVERGGINGGWV